MVISSGTCDRVYENKADSAHHFKQYFKAQSAEHNLSRMLYHLRKMNTRILFAILLLIILMLHNVSILRYYESISSEFYFVSTGEGKDGLLETLARNDTEEFNLTNLVEGEWPDESLAKLSQLLEHYEELHKEIVSNGTGKYIRWTCSWWCFGWGDRIRGIMTVLTLAIIHKRAFVIELDQVEVPLTALYREPSIHWSYSPEFNAESNIECLTPGTTCSCIHDKIMNASNVDMLSIHTNQDCAGYFAPLLPGWHTVKARGDQRVIDYGIEEVLNWKGILMQRVFPISTELEKYINETVPNGFDIALHIRSGFINGRDYIRFSDSPQALAETYARCISKVVKELAPEHQMNPKIFIATDNATFQDHVLKAIAHLNATAIDSSKIGGLGHVQQDISGGPNMIWRMMVDYEILRRAHYLLVAPSGFSTFAFKSRFYSNAKAYAPLSVNHVKECERVFTKNDTRGYWLDPY